MRSFIDLELDYFLVGVNKMLVIVLILQSKLQRIFLDITSTIYLFFDLMKQLTDFLQVGPKVRLNFRKNEHSVDFDLKRAMTREVHKLLFAFIVVSL